MVVRTQSWNIEKFQWNSERSTKILKNFSGTQNAVLKYWNFQWNSERSTKILKDFSGTQNAVLKYWNISVELRTQYWNIEFFQRNSVEIWKYKNFIWTQTTVLKYWKISVELTPQPWNIETFHWKSWQGKVGRKQY